MASLRYLWNKRARFSFCSKPFLAAWSKRLLTFPELVMRNSRRVILVKKGATISELAEVGKIRADGNKRNLFIDAYSFIGTVEFALHDRIMIGKKVCINDGVKLLSASHNVADPQWRHLKAPIIIDDYAWVCTDAIILPGVHVGRGAVIGAGAVVSKDVKIGEIVAGNPAKPIQKKRCEELTYNPCEFLAPNQAWLKG